MVNRHMELRPDKGGSRLAWDLQANSMVEMIGKARRICEANNRRFTPRDVLIWENQGNLDPQKKEESEKKPVTKKEKTT